MMLQKILILSQNDKHHQLETLGDMIKDWLADFQGVETVVSHDRAMLHQLGAFDLFLLCFTPDQFTTEEEDTLESFVRGGKALFAIHSATVVDEKNETYIDLVGGRFVKHSPYQDFQVRIADTAHPITAGLADFEITDELYVLDRAPRDAQILATAIWDDQAQPMVYTKPHGQGIVLYNALGHNEAAFNHATFQKLIIRGIQWLLDSK